MKVLESYILSFRKSGTTCVKSKQIWSSVSFTWKGTQRCQEYIAAIRCMYLGISSVFCSSQCGGIWSWILVEERSNGFRIKSLLLDPTDLAQAMTKHEVLGEVLLASSDALICVPPALCWLTAHPGKPSISRDVLSSRLTQYFLRILKFCFVDHTN